MKTSTKVALLLFFVFFILTQSIFSQTQISGIINTDSGQPMPYVNVLLLSSKDSSLIKGEVSNENGAFEFNKLTQGNYLIMASMIGFIDYYSMPFTLLEQIGGKKLNTIILMEDAVQLEGVEVIGKKPFFEQKIDRMVVNVAGSITASGSTALEVLERSPGVIVNRQNNDISLSGKNGVVVMINGKINRMPIDAVVQLLDGMPSSNIEKIELITTPPANFDAEGNAGFINIVLKQTNDRGLNGSFTLSTGYGRGLSNSASANFNFRKNKLNLYGDYSFNRNAGDQFATVNRQTIINNETLRTETITDRSPVRTNHNARLGLDLDINKNTVFGVLLSGYTNKWDLDSENSTSLFINNSVESLLSIKTFELNKWKHLASNVNLRHTMSGGGVLNFDLDHLVYDNKNPTDYFNNYNDPDGNFIYEEQTFSGKITPIRVTVGKIDYSKRFSENIKMDFGVKATVSHLDNDVTVSRLENGSMVNDPDLTADYSLEESIGAVYSSLDYKLDTKSSLKLGLRYEYTNSNLGTPEQADIVDRQYGSLFPSFFLSRKFNDNHSSNISYSRRITRPTFNDMAPFVIFIDPFTLFSGNAALQPSISNNVKLDYRFKTALFSIQYTMEDSAIARFQPQFVEGQNQLLIVATNMKNRKTLSFTAAFPIQLTDWWRMQNNFTGSWQEANSFLYGEPFQASTKSLRVVWINSFKLPANFSAELVGFYQSKVLFGTSELQPLGALNLGIQKKFNNNHGSLRFGIDDIFNTRYNRFESKVPEQSLEIDARFRFRYRTFKLSYNKSFGNNKLKRTRQRQTGSDDERKRVSNN